jgi:hypothetical protein
VKVNAALGELVKAAAVLRAAQQDEDVATAEGQSWLRRCEERYARALLRFRAQCDG